MEREEKKKNAIENPETDGVQKTFLDKVKSFFCFCKAEKNKNTSRLEKFNDGIKRSKIETQTPVTSRTTEKRDSLSDESQETFLEKLKGY